MRKEPAILNPQYMNGSMCEHVSADSCACKHIAYFISKLQFFIQYKNMEKNIKEIRCSNLREAGKLTVLTGTHARAKNHLHNGLLLSMHSISLYCGSLFLNTSSKEK
jgi:hypothetical protein